MKAPSPRKDVFASLPNSIRRGIEDLQYDFIQMEQVSDREFVFQIKHSIQTFFHLLEDAYGEGGEHSNLPDQSKSIEDAIQFISRAITNRLQSGRYLYEAGLFNPHNLGPFSKLYSFYESFIDLFESLLLDYNRRKNAQRVDSELSLLLDISKSSFVRADLFVPKTGQKFPKNKLIGITINEHDFFQIKDTIVLLLHEIGHHVRPYNRKKRNKVLLSIAFKWLARMTYVDLCDYMFLNVYSTYYQGTADEVWDKIEKLQTHFEGVLLDIVRNVIDTALSERFDAHIQTEKVTEKFGAGDQYLNIIKEFQRLLEDYFADLSDHLSTTLLSTKPEEAYPIEDTNGPRVDVLQLKFKGSIIGLMEKEDETDETSNHTTNGEEKNVSFDTLCKLATQLFNERELFGYKKDTGNSIPNRIIDCYIDSLSLLGLNESSPSNRNHFAGILIQVLKRSLETFREAKTLEWLIESLEESLAHMFWIRTLNITDFETYWKIMKPLIENNALNEKTRSDFFGVSNAILTEYFALRRNDEMSIESSGYEVLPMTPLTDDSTGKKKLEWLQEGLIIPVAKYLAEENDVFPENQLYQLDKRITSKNGKKIQRFREQYRKFINNTDPSRAFSNELEMIKFFEESAKVK